ncbi:MAG: glutamine-hydrolyzing GMP synthase [Thaumarchaeota archaeon]|nr:glutamine-hydrolyzing GMP synthase [Nitrososphaerota archaeon]
MNNDKVGIAVLDFGGQYSHLICRRVRGLGVRARLFPYDTSLEHLKASDVKGVILSGGPASVYDTDAPRPDPGILQGELPVLGICYGYQLLVQDRGGQVTRSKRREYGKASLNILSHAGLFAGITEKRVTCWMSHGDSARRIPTDFRVLASSANSRYAALASMDGKCYGVQFHPEVAQTEHGAQMLSNFVFGACRAKRNWRMDDFVRRTVDELSTTLSGRVLCAVSGGVDSSTTALLLHRAVGERLQCVFIDHGLLREGETAEVRRAFRDAMGIDLVMIDAADRFLIALKGIHDPEQKRKIVGRVFADVFEEYARKSGSFKFLAQGTVYPDIVESGRTSKLSAKIKTHHNVGGLPKDLSLDVVEPLKELYKDEVRKVAEILGLPASIRKRHPFPGPGLAVRIIGEVTPDKLRVCRMANKVVEEVVVKHGLYDKVWQALAYLGDDQLTGVLGDERKSGHQVTVKVVESVDAMTADWARLPYDALEEMSRRITNEIEGVVSVSYAVSSKPPSTIEPQ